MLGTLSRRSPLLHMLCERWQKAKNAVENPLQNTTSEMEHFGQQKNIPRDFATCEWLISATAVALEQALQLIDDACRDVYRDLWSQRCPKACTP